MKSYNYKLESLKKFAEDRVKKLQEAFTTDKEKSAGYLDRVIVKVVDNIRINLK